MQSSRIAAPLYKEGRAHAKQPDAVLNTPKEAANRMRRRSGPRHVIMEVPFELLAKGTITHNVVSRSLTMSLSEAITNAAVDGPYVLR